MITIQCEIDTNIGKVRKLVPLNRQFINKKTEMDDTLKALFNLGEDDSLIPTISEMYAIN